MLRPSMSIVIFSIHFRNKEVITCNSRLVNAMVYYGLALGTDNLGGDPYINFMIAGAVEIPAYIMCVLCLNRVGRKKPLTITMIFGGVSCIASAFVPSGKSSFIRFITLLKLNDINFLVNEYWILAIILKKKSIKTIKKTLIIFSLECIVFKLLFFYFGFW